MITIEIPKTLIEVHCNPRLLGTWGKDEVTGQTHPHPSCGKMVVGMVKVDLKNSGMSFQDGTFLLIAPEDPQVRVAIDSAVVARVISGC